MLYCSFTVIRLLSFFGTTDMQEAMALSHESETVQVYSNSWGPEDRGDVVEGPGMLLQTLFVDATQNVSTNSLCQVKRMFAI